MSRGPRDVIAKAPRFRWADTPTLKRIGIWLVVLLGLAPTLGGAMFAKMSDEELIRRSDLIVIGEWVGHASLRLANSSEPMEVGAISISEVLKGSPDQSLALVAVRASGAPRSGAEINYRRGDKGLWLLRQHQESGAKGIYLADHPQRFIPDTGGAERIKEIRRTLKNQAS